MSLKSLSADPAQQLGLFPSWPRSIVLEQLLQSGSYRYDLYRYARSLWTASSNQDAAKRFCKLHNLEVLQ